jgi:hypothetical protein
MESLDNALEQAQNLTSIFSSAPAEREEEQDFIADSAIGVYNDNRPIIQREKVMLLFSHRSDLGTIGTFPLQLAAKRRVATSES